MKHTCKDCIHCLGSKDFAGYGSGGIRYQCALLANARNGTTFRNGRKGICKRFKSVIVQQEE